MLWHNKKLDKKLREKAKETGSILEELALAMLLKGMGVELKPEDLITLTLTSCAQG